MQVKNIVRKAVALSAGAGVFATTIVGALAYDLSTYPAKYIVDGQFDGKIVVGERAATADVLGSIDIAASLQGASVSKVSVPGQAGKTTLSGDVFELSTGSDQLELREDIGNVVDTVTSSDLTGLKSGKISTAEGTTDYHQYLRLQDASNLQNITVNYVKNDGEDDEVMADYLVVATDLPFIEWEIQFPEGLESEVEGGSASASGSLDDLEDKTLNIMGTDYNIVEATVETDGGNFEMTLMGGSVPDTLREGETKTYNIDGVVYEVTLVFVSDPASAGSPEVKFSINGELTDAMAEGDTEILSGGLQIGVRDILVNAREGVASFFLGADKLVLTEPDTNQSDDFDGDIEINDEFSESDVFTVSGSFPQTSTFEITSMKYRVTMESEDGTGGIAFVPAGHGIRERMDEPELLLSETLDIMYEGLTEPETTEITLDPVGDDEYDLTFTNIQGTEYSFTLLSIDGGEFKYGDDDDLVFVESGSAAVYNIGPDDFFIVSNAQSTADKSVTNVLQYTDYDDSQRQLEFKEVGGGTISATVDTTGIGTFTVGGNTYSVNVSSVTATDPNLTIDLNDDGDYTDGGLSITTWGGVIIDPARLVVIDSSAGGNVTSSGAAALRNFVGNGKDLENASALTGQRVFIHATVLAKNFDTSNGDESFNWTISETASDTELDLDFAESNYRGPLEGTTAHIDEFQFDEMSRNSETQVGMTDYGILITEEEPDDSDDQNTLTLVVPEEQRFAQVFVTMGSVTASTSGAGSADRVNPIAVGLAVLDTDAPAVGTENLIVVGGPCANTVAAELLGNPDNCAEGFEPGKAMIKSWEKSGTVAILVAGYEATETLGASRVLASYKDYSEKLQGTEVEVVVADLNDIDVNPAN